MPLEGNARGMKLTKAQQKLVIDNYYLVDGLINKMDFNRDGERNGVSIPDLRQNGYFGLCMAALKYDVKSLHKFSTYATYWIRANLYSEYAGKDVVNIKTRSVRQDINRFNTYKRFHPKATFSKILYECNITSPTSISLIRIGYKHSVVGMGYLSGIAHESIDFGYVRYIGDLVFEESIKESRYHSDLGLPCKLPHISVIEGYFGEWRGFCEGFSGLSKQCSNFIVSQLQLLDVSI